MMSRDEPGALPQAIALRAFGAYALLQVGTLFSRTGEPYRNRCLSEDWKSHG